MSLDDASYPLLWKLALETKTPPEYFLAVITSESGLNTAAFNGKYSGLNQIDPGYLKARGVDPAVYRTWSASQQLEQIIIPFWKGQIAWWGKPLRSPGILHGLGLCLPDTKKSDDPDFVLAPVPGSPCGQGEYDQNKGLDFNGDGRITFQDLDDGLAARVFAKDGVVHSIYQAAYDKLYSMVPAGWVPPPHVDPATSRGISPWWVLGGLALVGGFAAAYVYRAPIARALGVRLPRALAARGNPLPKGAKLVTLRADQLEAVGVRGKTFQSGKRAAAWFRHAPRLIARKRRQWMPPPAMRREFTKNALSVQQFRGPVCVHAPITTKYPLRTVTAEHEYAHALMQLVAQKNNPEDIDQWFAHARLLLDHSDVDVSWRYVQNAVSKIGRIGRMRSSAAKNTKVINESLARIAGVMSFTSDPPAAAKYQLKRAPDAILAVVRYVRDKYGSFEKFVEAV